MGSFRYSAAGRGGNYTAGTSVGTYWVIRTSGNVCVAVVDVGGSGQATVT
jgi:hypothetical protein